MIRNIFGSAKIIPNRALNFFGLQVFRLLVSWIILGVTRKFPHRSHACENIIGDLSRNGFIRVAGFLSFASLNELKFICDEELLHGNLVVHGSTVSIICAQEALVRRKSQLFSFIEHSGIIEVFSAIENKKLTVQDLNISIEKTTFGSVEDLDPNREWHVDTFFSSYKGWIPLENISSDSFPTYYINGSNRMSSSRVLWEWIWSFQYQKGCNPSRRAATKLWPKMDGLASRIIANQGDLILADVGGMHRRGDGIPGAVRYWLRVGCRRSPFRPFRNLQNIGGF